MSNRVFFNTYVVSKKTVYNLDLSNPIMVTFQYINFIKGAINGNPNSIPVSFDHDIYLWQ